VPGWLCRILALLNPSNNWLIGFHSWF